MKRLIFATGNDSKFQIAQTVCVGHDIQLIQNDLEVDEIQHDDPTLIAIDKAQKAYSLIKKPVVITDDTWEIPGLGGFPGPYMKAVNQWFTPQDFINLTKSLTDRRVFITMHLAYCAGGDVKLLSTTYEGRLLATPKGMRGPAVHKVVSMLTDNGMSIAEYYDKGLDHSQRDISKGWHEFAGWFQ